MKTTTFEMKVHDFLAQKRIAVAGVSPSNSHHPAGNGVDLGHTYMRWILRLTGGLPT